MKIILFGVGSIGTRHLNNLRMLRTDVQVVMADPLLPLDRREKVYKDWRMALTEQWDADGVIIASPTECHAEQLDAALLRGLPAYVEKPLMTIGEWRPTVREALLHFAPSRKVVIGHQYRLSKTRDTISEWQALGKMHFEARDNLIDRYGPTVLETMGSHAIDLALTVLGKARSVALFSDGRFFKGTVTHERGESSYDMRIDVGTPIGGRMSTINGKPNNITNNVYLDTLRAWLEWIETGERDTRLATLAEGVAVMDVMSQCRMIAVG